MRFQYILATSASLIALASAKIGGISIPDTIRPGDGFNAIILTENYIQSVYDVSIAFGAAPGVGYQGALGTVMDTFYLGPEQSNVAYNITKWTTLPASVPQGPAVISASVFSLFGAGASPSLSNYNVSVTIGDSTSTNYVSSSV